jgi:hypothetical protein
VGFDITDQLPNRFSHLVGTGRKEEFSETVQLFIDFKKVYDSVKREVVYSIVMKLVQLIKMCLNETYSKICLDKHLFDNSTSYIQFEWLWNHVM